MSGLDGPTGRTEETKGDQTPSHDGAKRSLHDIVRERVQSGKAKFLSLEGEAKKFARSLIEKGRLSQEEGKKRIDELSHKLHSASEILAKVKENDLLKQADAFRKELEKKLGGRAEKLFETLGLPSREEVLKLSQRLESLSKKVGELADRVRKYGRRGH